MPIRSSMDLNETAFGIVQQSTGQAVLHSKNPAAVALGRLGGLKGGKARAEALTKAQRIEIACKAAKVRWTKEDKLP